MSPLMEIAPSIYIPFTRQESNSINYTIGSDEEGNRIFTLPIGDQIIKDQFERGFVLYKQSCDSFQFGNYTNTVLR